MHYIIGLTDKEFEKESRVVFRKLGFVMIYAVVSEISLSVLIPSLPL